MQFPFSVESRNELQKMKIDITTLPTDYPDAFETAFQQLLTLIQKNTLPGITATSKPQHEITVYAIIRVLIEFLNEEVIRNKFAVAVSKRTNTYLKKSSNQTILKLAKNTFNWRMQEAPGSKGKTWQLYFTNYLEAAPTLMGLDWKLVQQIIIKGWIYLLTTKLIRILEEKTKLFIQITRRIPREHVPEIPSIYESYLVTLQETVEANRSKFQTYETGEVIVEAYPPCINFILAKNKRGENLTHPERFFLVAFLAKIGLTVDKIIGHFKNQPDFNYDKTSYQVRHITDRGYMPYNRGKAITLQLCKRELDTSQQRWCQTGQIFQKELKNPLQYYRTKSYFISRAKQSTEEP
jgi:DNA primase large subunit